MSFPNQLTKTTRGRSFKGRASGFQRDAHGGYSGTDRTSDRNVSSAGNRPTHFLALPLDQHQELRGRVSRLKDGLLAAVPVAGVDVSIFQPTPRLHLTLGVMSLLVDDSQGGPTAGAFVDTGTSDEVPKTISTALSYLDSLRPEIMDILAGEDKIFVPLTGLAIMNNNPEQANVMYTGPGLAKADSVVEKVCLLVHNRFKEAGFVVETRPLKLHCTLMNTSFRKPRGRPFSYSSVLERITSNPIIAGIGPTASTTLTPTDAQQRADFGTWAVDEIHLYKMGSWDKDRRYVSVGHISLKASA